MSSVPPDPSRPQRTPLSSPRYTPSNRRSARTYLGHAQLSLVEHALCPLDATSSLEGPLIHEPSYWYSDVNRHRKQAHVRVVCPDGLSPSDEFYLWGLLSLTFSQPNPTIDFHATPHYCLRQLGCIDGHGNRGGKSYELFRNAVSRLASVTYKNDAFFDPVRGEHRSVGFGFLSYSLPLAPDSSRAWRFAWDPIFFEVCSAVRGSLLFDFRDTYRDLDEASRRLYLLLKKVFWRSDLSPEFDVRDLAVDTLGFSAGHEVWKLKQKLARCVDTLAHAGIITLPPGASSGSDLFTKRAKGSYTLHLQRGPHFDQSPASMLADMTDSPLFEPLTTIGLERPAIRRILAAYEPRLIAECADMTLAARERFGESFFTTSPQAYFMDNLQEQAKGKRTIPDWWRTLRSEEERRRRQADRSERKTEDRSEKEFKKYLETEARDAFESVMNRVFHDFKGAGKPDDVARETAQSLTEIHFRNRFFQEHPEFRGDGPTRAGDLLP